MKYLINAIMLVLGIIVFSVDVIFGTSVLIYTAITCTLIIIYYGVKPILR